MAHYCRGKRRGKGNQGRYRKEEDQNRLILYFGGVRAREGIAVFAKTALRILERD